MKLCEWTVMLIAVLLIYPKQITAQTSSSASGQSKSASSKKTKSPPPAPQNTFILSPDGSKYHLEKPIVPDGTEAKGKLHIEGQVGTIEGKPAFSTVLVDPKDAPKTPDEADDILHKFGSSETPFSQQFLQACTGNLVCVETRKDNGQDVCVKWECK